MKIWEWLTSAASELDHDRVVVLCDARGFRVDVPRVQR